MFFYFSKTILSMALFGVLPMVPLVILPMVPLVAYGTIGLPMVPIVPLGEPMVPTNGTIGRANGITNGTIGRTLNDIGIPLVPLVEP